MKYVTKGAIRVAGGSSLLRATLTVEQDAWLRWSVEVEGNLSALMGTRASVLFLTRGNREAFVGAAVVAGAEADWSARMNEPARVAWGSTLLGAGPLAVRRLVVTQGDAA